MTATGMEHPRVVVSIDNDHRLKPPGKRCAPIGMTHLPGHLQRTTSSPAVLTCPGGWLDEHQRMMSTRTSLRDTLRSSSQSFGASMRRGEAVPTISAPAGGRTQGARHLRPHKSKDYTATGDRPAAMPQWETGGDGYRYCADNRAYNAARHGWHTPQGQAEQQRLADPSQAGSWGWMMRKARDHNGYGDDGQVEKRDVQVTAVSGNGPTWFLGPKTVPGPFDTKSVPVRRCLMSFIDPKDGKLKNLAKSYKQGDCLNIVETLHDGPVPPTPHRNVEKTWKTKLADPINHPARRCNLVHGGCQTREIATHFPKSKMRYEETYDHGLCRRFR
eukprot:TRINITY_DN100772_c0_g1_i1.p1 TRINITY_DN100772_c0_g1~~TRINITY_DN100772_c0_g1_i1.p1  ORF type:complete len:330 (-),score=59.07 TRINITY_DN100772_c0_g1_i1:257-1246(-)